MNGGHGGFLQFHWRDVSISAAHPRHPTIPIRPAASMNNSCSSLYELNLLSLSRSLLLHEPDDP